jgi:hypothetical protein
MADQKSGLDAAGTSGFCAAMNVSPAIVAAFSDVAIFHIQVGYPVFAVGVWATLVGFRFIPLRPNRAKAEIGMKQWGRTLKFGGPAVLFLGLVFIAMAQ